MFKVCDYFLKVFCLLVFVGFFVVAFVCWGVLFVFTLYIVFYVFLYIVQTLRVFV